jgi:plastocyanin
MKRLRPALLAAAILLCPMLLRAAVQAQDAPAMVAPVPGDPGAFRIETAHGTTIARRPAPPASLKPPTAVFRVYPKYFDFNGDTVRTIRDTIVVVAGSTVSWIQYQQDFHTVTSGRDSNDPNAGSEFNAILDGATTRFDWTFTTVGEHDFFDFINLPTAQGTVIVIAATADVKPGVIQKASFTRPPAPNPTRGGLSFAIALPRTMRVQLTVHDVAGRTVATLEDAPLPPGDRTYRWDGRASDGRVLQSGRYFVRLAAGGNTVETRAVSLIR